MSKYDLLEYMAFGALLLVFIAAIILGIFGFIAYTCHRYGRITNREVRVAFPAACYVKTDKGWFTYEQVRNY